MDPFSAFSTAPSVGAANHTSNPGSNPLPQGHLHLPARNGSPNPALTFSTGTGSFDLGNRGSPLQQHQPQRVGSNASSPLPPSLGGAFSSVSATTGAPSGLLFSTSAATMPNHNSNLNSNHLGTRFGTFHLATNVFEGSTEALDAKALESIEQTLAALQSIDTGRHLVQWDALLDPSDPQKSGKDVSAALAQVPLVTRKEAIQAVARGITTPQHIHIVGALEEAYRHEVRDLVLQHLLGQLTRTGSEPMPVFAEMLAELARLNLVRLGGVVAAVEQFLSQPDKRRAGLAVLGRMAQNDENREAFLHAIQAANKVEPLLNDLYKDPQFEYDVLAIRRMLGNVSASAGGSTLAVTTTLGAGAGPVFPSLLLHTVLNTKTQAPVLCEHYFRGRDELVSGHADGTVVVWGSPNPTTGEVAPRLVLDLPNECLPVAMSAPARGQYLAIAGMPCPTSGSPYRPFLEAHKGSNSRMPAPASGAHPVVRILNCHEVTGSWTSGDTIVLPVGAVLTGVAALSSGVVCVAQSTPVAPQGSGNAGSNRHHQQQQQQQQQSNGKSAMRHELRFHNAVTGQLLHTIPNAHQDYITALASCEENDQVLLTGSRDGTIKVWDGRVSASSPHHGHGPTAAASNAAGGSGGGSANCTYPITPMFTLDTANVHRDTISVVYPFRNYVFSGSLDGTLCVWDLRQLSEPVTSRTFLSGVLDITALEGSRIAVATARGLHLVSVDTMLAVDILPNAVFTQLRCNEYGSIVFAAGKEGVSVFSMKK